MNICWLLWKHPSVVADAVSQEHFAKWGWLTVTVNESKCSKRSNQERKRQNDQAWDFERVIECGSSFVGFAPSLNIGSCWLQLFPPLGSSVPSCAVPTEADWVLCIVRRGVKPIDRGMTTRSKGVEQEFSNLSRT